MSQCQAPSCTYKNFEECQNRENNNTCEIHGKGSSEEYEAAQCIDITGGDNWTRTNPECNTTVDQNSCEKIEGCEWTYNKDTNLSNAATGIYLEKKCMAKKNDSNEGIIRSCFNDERGRRTLSRYNLTEQETFGCPKNKCKYVPEKKTIEKGNCVDSDGKSDNSDCGNITCGNNTNYEECTIPSHEGCCIWKSNDEGYCGYNRIIEEYLENKQSADPGKSELEDMVSPLNGDPCLKIQKPGDRECEEQGCIWDIYGNREDLNNFNSSGDVLDPYYYDINTTGLCRMPDKVETCMNYFCRKHSINGDGETENWFHPDGKCEYGPLQSNECVESGKEIIANKTPGLINFLPSSMNNLHEVRQGWTSSDPADGLNKTLKIIYDNHFIPVGSGAGEEAVSAGNIETKRATVLKKFTEQYKDNCEFNIAYRDDVNNDDIEKMKKKYDDDSYTCNVNDSTVANFEGDCTGLTFEHKDLTDQSIEKEPGKCKRKKFDIMDINKKRSKYNNNRGPISAHEIGDGELDSRYIFDEQKIWSFKMREAIPLYTDGGVPPTPGEATELTRLNSDRAPNIYKLYINIENISKQFFIGQELIPCLIGVDGVSGIYYNDVRFLVQSISLVSINNTDLFELEVLKTGDTDLSVSGINGITYPVLPTDDKRIFEGQKITVKQEDKIPKGKGTITYFDKKTGDYIINWEEELTENIEISDIYDIYGGYIKNKYPKEEPIYTKKEVNTYERDMYNNKERLKGNVICRNKFYEIINKLKGYIQTFNMKYEINASDARDTRGSPSDDDDYGSIGEPLNYYPKTDKGVKYLLNYLRVKIMDETTDPLTEDILNIQKLLGGDYDIKNNELDLYSNTYGIKFSDSLEPNKGLYIIGENGLNGLYQGKFVDCNINVTEKCLPRHTIECGEYRVLDQADNLCEGRETTCKYMVDEEKCVAKNLEYCETLNDGDVFTVENNCSADDKCSYNKLTGNLRTSGTDPIQLALDTSASNIPNYYIGMNIVASSGDETFNGIIDTYDATNKIIDLTNNVWMGDSCGPGSEDPCNRDPNDTNNVFQADKIDVMPWRLTFVDEAQQNQSLTSLGFQEGIPVAVGTRLRIVQQDQTNIAFPLTVKYHDANSWTIIFNESLSNLNGEYFLKREFDVQVVDASANKVTLTEAAAATMAADLVAPGKQFQLAENSECGASPKGTDLTVESYGDPVITFYPNTCTDPDGGTTCNAHSADSATCTTVSGGGAREDATGDTCVFNAGISAGESTESNCILLSPAAATSTGILNVAGEGGGGGTGGRALIAVGRNLVVLNREQLTSGQRIAADNLRNGDNLQLIAAPGTTTCEAVTPSNTNLTVYSTAGNSGSNEGSTVITFSDDIIDPPTIVNTQNCLLVPPGPRIDANLTTTSTGYTITPVNGGTSEARKSFLQLDNHTDENQFKLDNGSSTIEKYYVGMKIKVFPSAADADDAHVYAGIITDYVSGTQDQPENLITVKWIGDVLPDSNTINQMRTDEGVWTYTINLMECVAKTPTVSGDDDLATSGCVSALSIADNVPIGGRGEACEGAGPGGLCEYTPGRCLFHFSASGEESQSAAASRVMADCSVHNSSESDCTANQCEYVHAISSTELEDVNTIEIENGKIKKYSDKSLEYIDSSLVDLDECKLVINHESDGSDSSIINIDFKYRNIVYKNLSNYILSVTDKLINQKITFEEYSFDVARYLASLINYTTCTDTATEPSQTCELDASTGNCPEGCNFNECIYDPYGQEYVYNIDEENPDFETYQKAIELLPVKIPTSADSNTLSTFLGKKGAGGELLETYDIKHQIKDIIYKSGNALLLLEYQTFTNNVWSNAALPAPELVGTNNNPVLINTALENGSTIQIGGNINGTQKTFSSNTNTKYNDLFDGSKTYTIVGEKKQLIGNMVEIEISGVDPGLYDNKNIIIMDDEIEENLFAYTTTDDTDTGTQIGWIGGVPIADDALTDGAVRWVIKEVRLKDVPVDIYFEGDIDGLYKKNDIISIEGADTIFNENLKIDDTTGKYQRIMEVDKGQNKITVENAKRSGKYFVGREELERLHYEEDPNYCILNPGSAVDGAEVLKKMEINTQYSCNISIDTYNECKILSTAGDSGTDPCSSSLNCVNVEGKCLPKNYEDGGYIYGNGDEIKCSEIFRSNSSLEKTKCGGFKRDSFVVSSVDRVVSGGIEISFVAPAGGEVPTSAELNYDTGTRLRLEGDCGSILDAAEVEKCLGPFSYDETTPKIRLLSFSSNADPASDDDLPNCKLIIQGTNNETSYYKDMFSTDMDDININITPESVSSPTASTAIDDGSIPEEIFNKFYKSFQKDGITDEYYYYLPVDKINTKCIGGPGCNDSDKVTCLDTSRIPPSLSQELTTKLDEHATYSREAATANNICGQIHDGVTCQEALEFEPTDGDDTASCSATGCAYIARPQSPPAPTTSFFDTHYNANYNEGRKCIQSNGEYSEIYDDNEFIESFLRIYGGTVLENEDNKEEANTMFKTMCEDVYGDKYIIPEKCKYIENYTLGGFALPKKEGQLNNWRVIYLKKDDDNNIIKEENKILYHSIDASKNHFIRIEGEGSAADKGIYIISLKPPEIDTDVGVTGDDKLISIKNYVRNDVSFLASDYQAPAPADGTEYNEPWDIDTVTIKRNCDYNNGEWENAYCKLQSDPLIRIRTSDICERTGYKFNKSANLCEKEIKNTESGSSYCTGKSRSTDNTNKTNWGIMNGLNDGDKHPCSVCSWVKETTAPQGQHPKQYCEPLSRWNCNILNEEECGTERPGRTHNLSKAKACEYYHHNMEPKDIEMDPITDDNDYECTGGTCKIRKAEFNCQDITGGASSSTCSNINSLELCENENSGCEWKCPLSSLHEKRGYIVKIGDPPDDPGTTNLSLRERDKYHAPGDLIVTCADGYEASSPTDSTLPKAVCVRNRDTNTLADHSEVIDFTGCVPILKCQNPELTPEIIQTMFSNDPSSVPSQFKTDGVIDPLKLPNSDGSFQCMRPSTLKDNPEDEPSWSQAGCCQNVGLCSGNVASHQDVQCPTGQQIRMTYYEGNDTLSPQIGSTVETCCAPPEIPTITVPLDADYSELIVSENSVESQTFRENFIADIVSILNASEDVTSTITADMIEIVNIGEGSIVVTFKVLKDTAGEVVLTEQISRTLTAGTRFERVGAVTNAVPNFKPFDPKEKYLYYSDKFKTGITLEEAVISIFVTISLCLFCLVILGMLFK